MSASRWSCESCGIRAYIMTSPDANQAMNRRPPTMPSQRCAKATTRIMELQIEDCRFQIGIGAFLHFCIQPSAFSRSARAILGSATSFVGIDDRFQIFLMAVRAGL